MENLVNIFGFEIKRNQDKEPISIVSPENTDGSTLISGNSAGYYVQVMELEARIKNENDLIRRYREIAQYPDCETAIDEICNEAVVIEEDQKPITVNLDDVKLSNNIKTKISNEFDTILKLFNFSSDGHDLFRRWYIDGRIYFNIIVDDQKLKDGIKEIRPMDSRKARKIKNVKKQRSKEGVDIVLGIEEYFLFNDKGITESNIQGTVLPLDSVIYAPSGMTDYNSGMTLGYLHKAIKVVNQLKMMEDSAVIYRLVRSPERRIFYIDVGNLPKLKAEQYVNDLMNKFKNKIVFDQQTGEVKNSKQFLSTMEDFYIPRRGNGTTTQIDTLPGLENANAIEDIQYFQSKLFQSLNVPMSRLKGESGFDLGRASEITRDEIKFNKFINRIRRKFANIFMDALRVQLILKEIISLDDWDDIKDNIRFDFMKDNYYAELKELEILQSRLNGLQVIDPYVGKYYSIEWARKHVLRMDDQEIKEIDKQIETERQKDIELAQHQGEVQAQQQLPMLNIQNDMQKKQTEFDMKMQLKQQQHASELQMQQQEHEMELQQQQAPQEAPQQPQQ